MGGLTLSKVLIDWGYDRGDIYCPQCKKVYAHDIDETVDAFKLPKDVPVICRNCNKLHYVRRRDWKKAKRIFDKKLLSMVGIKKLPKGMSYV